MYGRFFGRIIYGKLNNQYQVLKSEALTLLDILYNTLGFGKKIIRTSFYNEITIDTSINNELIITVTDEV